MARSIHPSRYTTGGGRPPGKVLIPSTLAENQSGKSSKEGVGDQSPDGARASSNVAALAMGGPCLGRGGLGPRGVGGRHLINCKDQSLSSRIVRD